MSLAHCSFTGKYLHTSPKWLNFKKWANKLVISAWKLCSIHEEILWVITDNSVPVVVWKRSGPIGSHVGMRGLWVAQLFGKDWEVLSYRGNVSLGLGFGVSKDWYDFSVFFSATELKIKTQAFSHSCVMASVCYHGL